jgi:hypothetical protein
MQYIKGGNHNLYLRLIKKLDKKDDMVNTCLFEALRVILIEILNKDEDKFKKLVYQYFIEPMFKLQVYHIPMSKELKKKREILALNTFPFDDIFIHWVNKYKGIGFYFMLEYFRVFDKEFTRLEIYYKDISSYLTNVFQTYAQSYYLKDIHKWIYDEKIYDEIIKKIEISITGRGILFEAKKNKILEKFKDYIKKDTNDYYSNVDELMKIKDMDIQGELKSLIIYRYETENFYKKVKSYFESFPPKTVYDYRDLLLDIEVLITGIEINLIKIEENIDSFDKDDFDSYKDGLGALQKQINPDIKDIKDYLNQLKLEKKLKELKENIKIDMKNKNILWVNQKYKVKPKPLIIKNRAEFFDLEKFKKKKKYEFFD